MRINKAFKYIASTLGVGSIIAASISCGPNKADEEINFPTFDHTHVGKTDEETNGNPTNTQTGTGNPVVSNPPAVNVQNNQQVVNTNQQGGTSNPVVSNPPVVNVQNNQQGGAANPVVSHPPVVSNPPVISNQPVANVQNKVPSGDDALIDQVKKLINIDLVQGIYHGFSHLPAGITVFETGNFGDGDKVTNGEVLEFDIMHNNLAPIHFTYTVQGISASITINETAVKNALHFSGTNGNGYLDSITNPTGLIIRPAASSFTSHLSNGDHIRFVVSAASGYTISGSNNGVDVVVSGLTAAPATQPIISNVVNATIQPKVVKHGLTTNEIEPWVFNNQVDVNGWKGDWNIYSVQLPNSNKSFKFTIDADAKLPDAVVTKMINKFLKNTNFGYGMTTLDNIIITTKAMKGGANGGGNSSKDIIILCEGDYTTWTGDAVDFYMQRLFNSIQHEYGHHETLSLFDTNGSTQSRNLVSHNVIGSDMYKNAMADLEAEKTRLDQLYYAKVMSGNGITQSNGDEGLTDFLRPFYGEKSSNPQFAGYFYNKEQLFQLGYHLNDKEFLNRAMTIIEQTPWDDNDRVGHSFAMYAFDQEMVKYQLGSRVMIDPTNFRYTQDAKDLIDLYSKYVYGYNRHDGYGLSIKNNLISGYSDTNFDFIEFEDQVGNKFTTNNFTKVQSHFISKDTLFGEPTVINSSFAYHVDVTGSTYTVDENSVHFYQDTNHNGRRDAGDKEVYATYSV